VTLKGDEYRKRADDAEALAKASSNLKAIEMYRDAACNYRYLAEYEDRQDRWSRLH
jgi:hypothetical protein